MVLVLEKDELNTLRASVSLMKKNLVSLIYFLINTCLELSLVVCTRSTGMNKAGPEVLPD